MRILLAATLTVALSAVQARPVSSISARWMVDVERGVRIENAVVVIEGDRIAAAGPRTTVTPRGAVTDLGDVTLLPGMIDAHVHLLLGGAAPANAHATLLAGFTTVQDLGALNYANIRLRDDIAAGRTPGPRVVAAGPWLGVSGGTCDFQGIGVKGADAFRERVRKDVAAGADLIKVCASGWLAEAARRPDAYEISDEELRAAVDEAHRAKRRVAVHALSERAITAAVAHGAEVIVHGGFTPAATLSAMQRRGVWQLPTLWSFKRGNPADLYGRLRTHMSTAAAQNLPIAFGTDAGVIPHGSNANEFAELEAMGLTRPAALRAATLDAARAVGLANDVGRLAAGTYADIIAVAGDPLEDLRTLQKVIFVMKGGVTVRGRQ